MVGGGFVRGGWLTRWIDRRVSVWQVRIELSTPYLQEVAVGLALLHGVGGPEAERAYEEDWGTTSY